MPSPRIRILALGPVAAAVAGGVRDSVTFVVEES